MNGTYRLLFDSDGVQHFLTAGEGLNIEGNTIINPRPDWDVADADSDNFIINKPPITNEDNGVTQIAMGVSNSVRFGQSNQNHILFHETGNAITGFVNEIRSAGNNVPRDLNIRGGGDVSLESYTTANTLSNILRLENNGLFIGTSADNLQSLFLNNGWQTFLDPFNHVVTENNRIGIDSDYLQHIDDEFDAANAAISLNANKIIEVEHETSQARHAAWYLAQYKYTVTSVIANDSDVIITCFNNADANTLSNSYL